MVRLQTSGLRGHAAIRILWLAAGGALLLGPALGFAAETTDPVAMGQTSIVLKVDAQEPLAIRTKSQIDPPSITVEFPDRRVVGSLPEQSLVGKGAIQSIITRYEDGAGASPKRSVRSVQVLLSAPYAYHVRSEPGRIVIQVEHPVSVRSSSVEIGLRGGTVITGISTASAGERFRAMQEALAQATPTPWRLQLGLESKPSEPGAAASPMDAGRAIGRQVSAPAARTANRAPASKTASAPRSPDTSANATVLLIVSVLLALSLSMVGLGTYRLWSRRGWWQRAPAAGAGGRLPSVILLIEELMWRAFERQGYQLILESISPPPLGGTLRILSKDGAKSALLFAGNGPFFEKQTVERFLQIMHDASVEHGFLVASGSFTVPAQRLARERAVTLIGREQLAELLGTGATSEYFTKQLEQQHARLEEAKETLRQYAAELNTLRRQRNEASWYLGEERAKCGKLETQLEDVNKQLSSREAELTRWQQDATTLRRQWEESEWYLGEARARLLHLEGQLGPLQELARRAEQAESDQAQANWFLGEERAKRESVESRLLTLRTDLEAASSSAQRLQQTAQRLKQELSALRTYGERRRRVRAKSATQVLVELFNSTDEPIYSGAPRDLSSGGIGLETDWELAASHPLRARLRVSGSEPVESALQVVWQRAEGDPSHYHSGCEFVDAPEAARTLIDQFIEQTGGSTG